ncbi:MAG: hypothetical protein AAF251_16040 [Pseudomonadota bacterium]
MAERDLFDQRDRQSSSEGAPDSAPLAGTRNEAVQRLQVGLTGLCAMILIIGIASVIGTQANIAEEAAVPDAAPTTEPTAAPPQRDPLADAGVVPDIPAQPEAEGPEEPTQSIFTDPSQPVIVPDTEPTEPRENDGGR